MTSHSAPDRALHQFLTWLIRPHPSLDDPIVAEKARLLLITLITAIVTVSAVAVMFLLNQPEPHPSWRISAGVAAAFFGLYWLARGGSIMPVAAVMVAGLMVLVTVAPFTTLALASVPFYIVSPLLLIAIFFSRRIMVLAASAACVAIVVLTLVLTPGEFMRLAMVEKLVLTFGVSSLIIVFVAQRDSLERVRRNLRQEEFDRANAASQRALQESDARFRSLFQTSFMPMVITTPGKRSAYIEANNAYLNLIGYTWDEVRNRPIEDIGVVIHDAQREERLRTLQQVGFYKEHEIHLRNRQGEQLDVLVSSQQTTINGEVYEIEIMLDITERRRQQARDFDIALERARTQLLTRFVQQASHEFRTPLTNIGTSAYLISKVSAPEKQQVYIQRINEQIRQITQLLSMMVTLTQLESGVTLKFQQTDLSVLFGELIMGQSNRLAAHQVTVTCAPGLMVRCDAEWLTTALEHLIDNAVRYTPPGGAITLHAFSEIDRTVIAMRDAGVGMEPDTLTHIFEMFWRLDEAHSTSGFGLGLPIVKRIVELHAGTISVTSTPDEGSCFTIRLPEQ